jgi:HlyD family secretion protein
MMSRHGARFWLLLLGLSAGGCGGVRSPSTDAASNASPVAVQVVTPQLRTISRNVSQPGFIQAFEQTAIFAKVPGYVLKWSVDIGDEVRKDDLLAELWVPELVSELNFKKVQVQQANKSLAMAQAQLVTAKAQVKEAEAGLRRAEALNDYWKSQAERFTNLVNQSVLDKQTQEETHNQFKMAAAGLTEAQARIESASALQQEKEAARDKAEVDIRAAEAALQQQADLVGYAKFLAPYAGVVTKRNINTFDFVQPPTAGKGEPLYVVERRDLMRVFVDVPEADAVWVSKGSQVQVRIPALQGRVFSGQVARTAYALDRTTRTLLAEIDFPNPQDQLRPGMYAYATIEGQWRDVKTLPASATLTVGDVNVGYQMYCFIVENGRLRKTQIETGARNAQLVQVLKKRVPSLSGEDGLRWEPFTGGELVVQGDVAGLKDGQAVEANPQQK